MTDLFDNPLGTDGFEFVEFTAPDPERLKRAVRADGLHRRRPAPLQERPPLPPGRHQLHPQHGAGRPAGRLPRARTAPRPTPWPSACRTRPQALAPGRRARRDAGAGPGRADGAEHSGHRGHRRLEPLSGRPLRRAGDLRRRLRADRAAPRRRWRSTRRPDLSRPPDPQRLPRPTWTTGPDFYERIFNFREIRYFDIEGQQTGLFSKAMTSPCGKIRIPLNESQDDAVADRGVSARLPRRGHPARRAGDRTTSSPRSRRCASAACASRTRRRPISSRSTRRVPGHGEDVAAAARRPHPDRRRAQRGPGPAAADLHREPDRADLLRDHPAQGQRGLRRGQLQGPVRVAWSWTRFAAAC